MAAVFIYGLYDPHTSELRYVGKAKDVAARLKGHLRATRRTPVYDWIKSLRKHGLAPIASVMEVTSDHEWCAAERRVVAAHRQSGRLLNVADGGDEPFCPMHVRAENGRRVAARRDKRVWRLKREMGQALMHGHVSEAAKEKLRYAAARAPHLFGEYASI
jgi:hypothetical protein